MWRSSFLLILTFLNLSNNVLAQEWITSSLQSCSDLCGSKRLSAVSSGDDGSGFTFYVCRGTAGNGEKRPGFNIATSPDSNSKCLFELGGGRGESKEYDCLCGKNEWKWVTSSLQSCSDLCKAKQLSAVSSGDDRYGFAFYVCRGTAGNGEKRPGFNIATSPDSNSKCLFELGGGRGESKEYDCLCK